MSDTKLRGAGIPCGLVHFGEYLPFQNFAKLFHLRFSISLPGT